MLHPGYIVLKNIVGPDKALPLLAYIRRQRFAYAGLRAVQADRRRDKALPFPVTVTTAHGELVEPSS